MGQTQSVWYEDKSYEVPIPKYRLIQSCLDMVDSLRGDQRCEYELKKNLGTPVYNSMEIMIHTIEKELNINQL